MENNKIDIALLWVDGSDEEWLRDYRRYVPSSPSGDTRVIRFRDWELLRYWFRGIEAFAPWVGTVHLVTAGHTPGWLNQSNPKLHLVKHQDFIPKEYLPTFNANAIELNLHRIESLPERFVYFNDDMFVLSPIKPGRFFKRGLPCDCAVMTAKPSSGGIIRIAINDLEVLEEHFDKHRQVNKHWGKWFNLRYGKGLLNNALLYPWREFSGFIDPHLPSSFLKSTFEEVWRKAPDVLGKTCSRKFRANDDVNQWLIRYWQLAEGHFAPHNIRRKAACIDINDCNLPHICKSIEKQEYELICLNDSENISDFERAKALLCGSFDKILPQKSSFELE
jgi:hypothetical protein